MAWNVNKRKAVSHCSVIGTQRLLVIQFFLSLSYQTNAHNNKRNGTTWTRERLLNCALGLSTVAVATKFSGHVLATTSRLVGEHKMDSSDAFPRISLDAVRKQLFPPLRTSNNFPHKRLLQATLYQQQIISFNFMLSNAKSHINIWHWLMTNRL